MPSSEGALKLRGLYMGLMNRKGLTKTHKAKAKAIKLQKGVCAAISFMKLHAAPGAHTKRKARRQGKRPR